MTKIYNILIRLCYCAALLLCFTACISEEDGREEGQTELQVGDRLPNFQVTMHNGQTVCTEDLRGKCSVIVFFNTQCPDCQEEFVALQRLYEECPYPMQLLCISRKESLQSISAYWEKQGLTLPFSAQEDAAVYHLFAHSVIPRVYVSDKDLIIRSHFTDNPVATFEDLSNAVENASIGLP